MLWKDWEDQILSENRFFTHEELRSLFLPHRTEIAIRKRRNNIGAGRLTHCKVCSKPTPVLNRYHLCKDHYAPLLTRKNSVAYRYVEYKKSAVARSINWGLSIEDFASFWNSHCFYCNDKIQGVGLDRIDSSKGYETGNVVACCTMCNRMKMNYPLEDWLAKIRDIHMTTKGRDNG